MPALREMNLVDASVPRTATFAQAARALFASGVAAIAVLDEERYVVGVFTDDDLLGGVFPGYLRELRHTAFLSEESDALTARLEKASGDPVERHMTAGMTVEIETSATHVAERFLHCPWGALAVVEEGRFVGMIEQIQFVEAVMRQLGMRKEEETPSRPG